MTEILSFGGETDEPSGNQVYSPELARAAQERLNVLANDLIDAHPHHSNVLALRAQGAGTIKGYPRWWIPRTAETNQGEHEDEMRRAGYVEMFAFKYRGAMSSASISGKSPKRDEWHARFQLPKLPGTDPNADPVRMLVLDTWSTPANDRSPAESGSGLPASAYDLKHFVYGRNEFISPEALEQLEIVLDLFDTGVTTVINES